MVSNCGYYHIPYITMKPLVLRAHPSHFFASFHAFLKRSSPRNLNILPGKSNTAQFLSSNSQSVPSQLITCCSSHSAKSSISGSTIGVVEAVEEAAKEEILLKDENLQSEWKVAVGNPKIPSYVSPVAKLSLSDQAFFLLAFIACTTSVAFTSLVIAAVPMLYAMGRAATSLSKLADTAREELPSTMAAIRLSGMEISDLTLELNDLSQEIADGISKSAQAVQAAEAGIRQIGSLARQQTMSMIQERASLPIISLQPVVAGAAKKTSEAVGRATKTFINMLSEKEPASENDDNGIDRVEI
ncbi:putative Transmembrane protein [Quillaja saponaria]|uniref:Transmembrane protein n=1 Tax=Quillaja saponaria TaxID=32244 RepID=A0AAD7M475_QUISA|nr:putative Transmembrane protein [Quillaja saponaria]